MGWKILFSLIFILFASFLLIFYWFIPFQIIEFGTKSGNFNFSLGNESGNMQFYQNMRYPSPEISYQIYDCPLSKKNNMERSFEIISNVSILNFYSVNHDGEIFVTCDSKNKMEEGLFIAGEGGPTNITQSGNFYVILHGSILLIRESKCERPNIAIHELLHALGFDHSENPNNIMYPISKCAQTIGEDIPKLISELYLTPSYADLNFENVSAVMNGRYLDINMSIRNNGLKDSEEVKIIIYADEEFVKEIDLDALKIGYGKKIMLSNVWVPKINVNKLEFFINSSFSELEKNNNRIILEIKKIK
jgi:ribosomal protein L24E